VKSWFRLLARRWLILRMGRRRAEAYLEVLEHELTDEQRKTLEKVAVEKLATGKASSLEGKILLRQIAKRVSAKAKDASRIAY
jgi:hypothetical protein